MKAIRQIGSLAFVLGLFVTIFFGVPWHVIVADDPPVPMWLKISIFCLLGGILIVLITLVIEQKTLLKSTDMPTSTEPEGNIILLNTSEVPKRETQETLGLVQGHRG